MAGTTPGARTRLVVIGTDDQGRSTVMSDGPVTARADRPKDAYPNMRTAQPPRADEDGAAESDYYAEELWRLDRIPTSAETDGSDIVAVEKYPPPAGASVRKLSLPPTGDHVGVPDYDALYTEFGKENVSSLEEGLPVLHRHPCLHVITFLSGSCYFIFRTGEVLLEPGDTIVLRGDMHDWRNPFDKPAVILATVFPLDDPAQH
jgi:hypothetical protein